jgi:hypothetical protein
MSKTDSPCTSCQPSRGIPNGDGAAARTHGLNPAAVRAPAPRHLGNVEILSRDYGVIDPAPGDFLRTLRIGYYTLQELYNKLKAARRDPPDKPVAVQKELPEVFTYFDCTDYVDCKETGGPETPLLTFALRTKRRNALRGLSRSEHLQLLFAYARQKINVHGGYFQGEFCQQLMYRFACLGYDATMAGYGGVDSLSAKCKEKQIRMLLSPDLMKRILYKPGVVPAPAEVPPPPPLSSLAQ